MIQLGQYPPPSLTIAHFSDPHFLGGDRALYGAVDTRRNLAVALGQLERSGVRPAAIVFTGDLADLGERDAYRQLRLLVEPVVERIGAQLIWVMGNHDERGEFQAELYDEPESDRPQDRVHDLGGLRLIALDTSVPGYHHGDISDTQFDWLASALSEPAPLGTVLAMHHPPLPAPVEVMAILELRRHDRLAEVLTGTDVRGILAGHLHHSTHGMFAGIPVSVASASCYTIDLSGPPHALTGVSGGQAFSLAQVYPDQIVHSAVPLGDFPVVSGFDEDVVRRLAAMTPEDRLEAFSRKRPAPDPAVSSPSAAPPSSAPPTATHPSDTQPSAVPPDAVQ